VGRGRGLAGRRIPGLWEALQVPGVTEFATSQALLTTKERLQQTAVEQKSLKSETHGTQFTSTQYMVVARQPAAALRTHYARGLYGVGR
jgi:hypothetical protein